MAYIRPDEAHEHFRDRVLEGVRNQFPMEGSKRTIELEGLSVDDSLNHEDLREQHKARIDGSTWAVPVKAKLVMKDKETGEVVDRKEMNVTEIPRITKRYSYIVGGQEYQMDNQWQLKPGIYTRRRQNGELESRFNVVGRSAFDVVFHPETKQFVMEYKDSKIPMYEVMKATGVSDDVMRKTWGSEIFEANRTARRASGALEQFYKATMKKPAPSKDAAADHLRKVLSESRLDPDATEMTVGKAMSTVSGDSLHLATKRLLKVQGGAQEDDRDNLVFKNLRSVGDFAFDSLEHAGRDIRRKAKGKLSKEVTSIRDVVKFDTLNKPMREVFTKNTSARVASQINPAEMVSASLQTTLLGPGGIKSEQSVTEDAKLINPSHFGFLDPINTPEGPKTGITLRLASGVKKEGNKALIPLYNVKKDKTEYVDPKTAFNSKVVLGDQVRWEGNTPKPLQSTVKMLGSGNEPTAGKLEEADYVMRRPSHFMNVTTNLIPFMNNTNGARAGYASRFIEQAISLIDREAPLVQSATGVAHESYDTYDKIIGSSAAHQAPTDGKVVSIEPEGMVIEDKKGKKHEVQLYSNFPLNDAKSAIHSEPIVKVGDRVKAGQTVADTNYTRQGALALGTNLKVGFVPHKGYNFEDGVVISESAAKRLSSQHLHKSHLDVKDDLVFNSKKFAVQHPEVFTRDQHKMVDADGVVRKGTRVKPGDPLIMAMRPFQVKERTGISAIRKSLSGTHTDASVKWEGEHEGEVVDVHRRGDKIRVHVKTVEPMQVGDKLCFDEETEVLTSTGWKSVSGVTLEDEVCCLTEDGVRYQRPTDVHVYARGGRMYRIESQQVDLFVTAEHKMYIKRRGRFSYELVQASEVFGKRVRYKKDGRWQGQDLQSFVFPALEVRAGQFGNGVRLLPARALTMRTYLMLLGAYLADGNIVDQPKSGSYGIEITKIKEPHRTELRDALQKAGIEYQDLGARVRILSKQFMLHFKMFGRAHQKYIPNEVFSLSPELLQVLFRWLMWGDGHVKDRPISYSTVSKQLADDVQRLCLHLGMAANIKKLPGGPGSIKGKEYWFRDTYDVRIITSKLEPQVNHGHSHKQHAQQEYWVEDYQGPVFCVTVPSHVLYVRRNGKPVWSGNSGRHGNKGIVTKILPDEEMPRTKEAPLEVLMNPAGVPGRMNVGQVLEAAAGKIAQKTGKTYKVDNFKPGNVDTLEDVQRELKAHGLTDAEEVVDPTTNKSLGKVMTGPMHISKMVHQIDKKMSVRPGMTLPGVTSTSGYTTNLQPSGGGHAGGQSIGSLGTYALLAHGARANLREMQSYKSEGPDPRAAEGKGWPSQHNQIWAAIQMGTPLPTPRPTFAVKKFENMLKGAGINIEKKGHEYVLGPMTNKQILDMSSGELKDPTRVVIAKTHPGEDPKPLSGGIFDERVTGGHGGNKWSHIKLSEPLPNPVFEGPIKHLTGLTKGQYDDLVYGKKALGPNGQPVEIGLGATGGAAIKKLLDGIDVDKELARHETALKKAPASKVDATLKKVKYLRSLKEMGEKPADAYMLQNLPVIPPSSRPLTVLQSGDVKFEDINGLYKDFGQVNKQLGDPTLIKDLPERKRENLRRDYYDGVKAIMGAHVPYGDQKQKGLLHTIQGPYPKKGYFQDSLSQRKQDMSMRSTIVPEPALGLDEVALPKHAAMQLYAPFVVRNLVLNGAAPNALAAQKVLAESVKGKKNPLVDKALDQTMEERPVLLKRDPVLHKYGIQSFRPRTTHGNAIKIHPFVVGGYGADFDGDTMSVYVPVTDDAVREAQKMMPTNNLFAESSGSLVYTPSLEGTVGVFKLGNVGKKTNKKFSNAQQAIDAVKAGKVKVDDQVMIGGKASTAGRATIALALPEAMRAEVMHKLDKPLTKKGIVQMLSKLGKDHPKDFGDSVNKIKDLGFGAAFGLAPDLSKPGEVIPMGAHTLTLDDLKADKATREPILRRTAIKVQNLAQRKDMSAAEKEHHAVQAWLDATDQMQKAHEQKMAGSKNNLFISYQSGEKPKWAQYSQLAVAPMLMKDSKNRIIPVPITKTYGEGLDISGYWTHLHGTRRGTMKKVQEVQEPGYLTKLMQNTASHINVVDNDCGTDRGISMPVADSEVHDRYLQKDFKAGNVRFKAGTVLSPDVVGKMRAADKNAQVVVRSPLRCAHGKGLCQKCMGLGANGQDLPVGHAAGVVAAQAIGERAVQLSLKEFHTGGSASGAVGLTSQMQRLQQLTRLPAKIPDAATLATKSGRVDKIERDATGAKIWVGGKAHHVGRDRFGKSLHTPLRGLDGKPAGDKVWRAPFQGMKVEPGQPLSDPSRTVINPHDLFRTTKSVSKLQNHLTNEIHDMYRSEGVKRKHVEVLVKAMTSHTKVRDAPDDAGVLRGEVYSIADIDKMNKQRKTKGLSPIVHEPDVKGINVLPHDTLEDWMARMQHDRLRQTVMESAATLGRSNIHGTHPVPGLVHGAEFGLTGDHAKRPGLGHLAGIPRHHY